MLKAISETAYVWVTSFTYDILKVQREDEM